MGKIGDRLKLLKGRPLPSYEFAFDTLPEAELKACLAWECYREVELFRQQATVGKAKGIAKVRLRQGKKSGLPQEPLPWMLLSPEQRAGMASRIYPPMAHPNAFRLMSELSPNDQFLLSAFDRYERIEVVLDWSRSTKRLVKSFRDWVTRLRRTPGTKASLTPTVETRGQRRTVRNGLFLLALWRCHKAGLNGHEALVVLDSLRRAFGPSSCTVTKRYASLAREGERVLQQGVGERVFFRYW